MNVQTIRTKIREIENVKHDPEAAHALEDNLYISVLEAIMYRQPKSVDEAAEWAAEALEATGIDFPRWAS